MCKGSGQIDAFAEKDSGKVLCVLCQRVMFHKPNKPNVIPRHKAA